MLYFLAKKLYLRNVKLKTTRLVIGLKGMKTEQNLKDGIVKTA